MTRPLVAKVGGSLYDLPDLGARLRRFLADAGRPVRFFPGGGDGADAIRALDRVHRLGDVAAHWLALRVCSVNGHFLASLLPGLGVGWPEGEIVDAHAFALDDERRPDHWPHRWEVTSDSMALRVAQVLGADLTLLKSVDRASDADWTTLAARGAVDPFFPEAAARSPGVAIRWVNLRAARAVP